MKLKSDYSRGGYGVLTVLCVLTITWLMNLGGLFSRTDQLFDDVCQSISKHSRQRRHVLLVYAPEQLIYSADRELENLLTAIQSCDPKKIGIVADRRLNCTEELSRLTFAKDLILGNRSQLWDHSSSLQQGFIDLQLADQAVYRNHVGSMFHDGEVFESFERVLASQVLLAGEQLPSGRFGIKFVGGVNSLPNIDASEFLNGNVVPELVKDKIVLVGTRTDSSFGFVTPTTPGAQRMNRLELHGNIVETLLRRDFLITLGPLWIGLLLVLTGIICGQLFRQLSVRWLPQTLLILVLFQVAVGWFTFHWVSVQLPIPTIMTATLLMFCIVTVQRFQLLSRATEFWEMMMQQNRRDVFENNDPDKCWDMVTDAVFQMFYPNRMALMELSPGATHLRVVRTIHCEADKIFEQRRDVQRSPFREAVECGRSIAIQNRSFFVKYANKDETEIMVPLIFASQLIGFMVIGMDTQVLEKWQGYENFLNSFSTEMAVLLANDRAAANERKRQGRIVKRLQRTPEERVLKSIESRKADEQSELQRLVDAFELSSSPMAICDVFGRIMNANSRLINLLQDTAVVVGETNCVEMISKLTNRDRSECRRVIRSALIDNKGDQIYMPPSNERKHPCMLFVKPLLTNAKQPGEMESRRVMIEIAEGKIFEFINELQNQLTETLCAGTRQQVSGLHKTVKKIKDQGVARSSFELLFGSLAETFADVIETLDQCETIARSQLTENPQKFMPIETRCIYDSAVQKCQDYLEHRGIQFANEFDDERCVGIANPLLLERVFSTILDFLLQNAFDQAEIAVSACSIGSQVHYSFHSQGGGTPIQSFRKSLGAADSLDPIGGEDDDISFLSEEQCDRFNEIREWLLIWNGSMRVTQRPDFGLSIELTLINEMSVNRRVPNGADALEQTDSSADSLLKEQD